MPAQTYSSSAEAKLNEIVAAFVQAEEREGQQDRQQWLARHPGFASELAEFFADQDAVNGFARENESSAEAPPVEEFAPPLDNIPPLVPFPAQREQLVIGSTFARQFEIFAIKHGGMGRVYLTNVLPRQQGDLAGKVAIKTIPDFEDWREGQRANNRPADRRTYDKIAARFQQEAETWVRLGKRANILWAFFVFDIGSKPYLVMEYAEEGDLQSWIAQGQLSIPLALNLAIQFCRGMAQAFEACQLVHRDIKPANVLLTRGHLLRIADFGLSKAFDESRAPGPGALSGDSSLSQTGAGTVAYMAPEQFASLANADTRSDIYSFGVMFCEMLTGKRLFAGRTAQEHFLARTKPLPDLLPLLPGAPVELPPILTRCLAFDPKDRYRSFGEIETELVKVYQRHGAPIPIPEDKASLSDDLLIQNVASSMLSLRLFEATARHADQGIRLFPQSAGHWINRGAALAELGNWREATACQLRATALGSGNALAWANLASGKLVEGDAVTALKAAMTATRLAPDLAQAWWTRGGCERRLGRLPEAVESFRQAVQASPHDWRSHHHLGSCLLEANQSQEAIQALREAAHIHPSDTESWRLLAVAFGKLGRHGEARQAIDRAVELEQNHSDNWAIGAAVLFQSQGTSPVVRECLAKALQLDPTNGRARQLETMIMASRSTAETTNPNATYRYDQTH